MIGAEFESVLAAAQEGSEAAFSRLWRDGNPALLLEHIDTRSALSLVAWLPPHQAEVILLRVVAGLDNETVAQMLGRSPGAVRVAAHRGLRAMARILAEADVTL